MDRACADEEPGGDFGVDRPSRAIRAIRASWMVSSSCLAGMVRSRVGPSGGVQLAGGRLGESCHTARVEHAVRCAQVLARVGAPAFPP